MLSDSGSSQFGNQKTWFVDSMIYSDRHIWPFRNFPHRDFYPFPKIARPEESAKYVNYEFITKMTVKFLDTYLKNDKGSRDVLIDPANGNKLPADYIVARNVNAAKPLLTPTEFLSYVRFGDMGRVKEAWANESQRKVVPQNNFFSVVLFLSRDGETHAYDAFDLYVKQYAEDPRNRMLYNFLGGNLMKSDPLQAVGVYKIYAQQFPDSPQAFDLLAEACKASTTTAARKTSAKVIELLPKADVSEEDKRSLQQRAQDRLK